MGRAHKHVEAATNWGAEWDNNPLRDAIRPDDGRENGGGNDSRRRDYKRRGWELHI